MTASRTAFVGLALSAALAACGGNDPHLPAPDHLSVNAVAWNPTMAPLGTVAAIVEDGTHVVVFSDTGATVIAEGVVALNDSTIQHWRDATTIPAADGSGSWVVGIDAMGHLYRLRAEMAFEAISDRYGLAGDNVHRAASLGGAYVAFALDHGIAVSNGIAVTRYDDPSFTDHLAGGGARAAGSASGMVRVFDAQTTTSRSFPLGGADYVSFDPSGRLVVATGGAIYFESAPGVLDVQYEGNVHGLAVSGGRVWFASGSELGIIEGAHVSITSGQHLAATARLAGSPNGDVWVIDGSQVQRFSCASCGNGPDAMWRANILPVYTRSCAQCHRPGGSAGIDLSSYDAWNARRALIRHRVIDVRDMPPPGNPLSDVDRAAIDTWTAGM